MRLLTTSAPEKRNTVRILFYGQSITEQGWWKIVSEDLKKRFPHADLVIENRAIGGHSSQLLVKTAEADLYPFQPDLLIFHVYGSDVEYEEIIRSIRARTTAEILLQTDHVTKVEDLTEETDASKLTSKNWDAFMNHRFLPRITEKYQAALCDQRLIWKQYLNDYHLEPSALLSDSVHLNPHGEFLMAEAVKACLRADPTLGPSPAEARVRTLTIGEEVHWENDRIVLEFEGTRVDLISRAAGHAPIKVQINGKRPSEFPGVYGFTRTTAYPQSSWPCVLRVQWEKPLQVEEWTATLKNVGPDTKTIQFELTGSKTGKDSSGEVGKKFVSNSGRVVLDPDDWNLDYCMKVFGAKLLDGFEIKWNAVAHCSDEYTPAAPSAAGLESTQTIAQGLPPGKHRLELTSDDTRALSAIRIHQPAGSP